MSCSLIGNLPNAWLASNYCAFQIPVLINQPRSIISLGISDLIALERATNSVVLVQDTNNDGIPDLKTTLVTANRLNHGLALASGFIYASSDEIVWRWPFDSASKIVTGPVTEVVSNINADGNGGAPFGHTTRTLAFDSVGRLYISVGSNENIDPNSFRARIRRFDVSNTTSFPLNFEQGEVFADGLRNEVGLAFDEFNILWGVENSADKLVRDDLGGDIHNDNPAEELNRFNVAGRDYGYPFCWSEFNIPQSGKPGEVWAWPSFLNSGAITDAQCKSNYVKAEVALQAHSAPLGITFYKYQDSVPATCTGGQFPKVMNGYAFIAYHGSWNRDVPTGYKVVYVKMNSQGRAISGAIDLLTHLPPNAKWEDGFRPVDVEFDSCGRLLVSSDGTDTIGSKLVRIEYAPKYCFSGQTTVEVYGRGTISMASLKLGDEVLVSANRYEKVYSFGHYHETTEATFLQFLPFGLEISTEHMVYINKRYIPASAVKVGDQIETASGETLTIETINVVNRKGVYAPFTMSGTIVVSNVKVSSYVAFQDSDHLSMGKWTTPFTFQWIGHLSQSPHRVWVLLFGIGVENYTAEGMSTWIYLPFQIGEWFVKQNFFVSMLVFVPILVCLLLVCGIEMIIATLAG